MKSTVFLLYEVDLNEIKALPYGFRVLQVDKDHNDAKSLLQAQVDTFSANSRRFKYFLFDAPPLTLSSTYSRTAAEVQQ